MTDPIADLLTRIRNAILTRRQSLDLPSSTLKLRVAQILKDEGFVDGVQESPTEGGIGKTLSIALRWDAQNRPAITGLRRVSKPGQRSYAGKDGLLKVRGGLGTSIISTSKGVMTDRQARKDGVGGEILCEVW